MTKRKLPIKTKEIELDGEFEGWKFTARTNPKMKTVSKLISGDLEKALEALSEIVKEWNFVDEDGEPIPLNKDGCGELTRDLTDAVTTALMKTVMDVSGN